MAEPNELFQLITSLSKEEKSYFKRFAYTYKAKENKDYLTLFDLIAKQTIYNERPIQQKLKGSKLLNNFSASKRHLTDLILDTFINSPHTVSLEEEILITLSHIHFLNQHKNYGLSKKKIKQLKKIFNEQEIFNFYPIVYQYELEIYTYQKEDIAARNKLSAEYELALKCMNNIREYEQLKEVWISYTQRSQAYARDEKQTAEYKTAFSHILLSDEKMALCAKSKNLFHYVRTGYFLLLNEADNAYKEAIAHYQFFLQHDNFRIYAQRDYILFLANFLNRMQNVDNYELLDEVKSKLLTEFETCKDKDLVNAKKLNLIYAEKNKFSKNGDYAKSVELIPEMLQALSYYKKRKDIELTVIYDIAMIYFYNQDFVKSLEYINQLLNHEHLYTFKDLESYSHLVRIFIMLEMNKTKKMDSLLENTKKKLSRDGKLFGMENLLFRLLNDLLIAETPKEKRKIILKYQPKIEKILENPMEQKALKYFNIQHWMQVKLAEK